MLSDGAHATRDQPDLREIRAERPHIPREDRQPAGLSVCAHEKIREHAEAPGRLPHDSAGRPDRLKHAPVHPLESNCGAYCGLIVDSPLSWRRAPPYMPSFSCLPRGALLEAILRWSSRAVVAEICHGLNPGAVRETSSGERGARGRGSHPRTREALGLVRRHYARLPSMAGRGCDEGAVKTARIGEPHRRAHSPEVTGPGTEIAASGAPDGERADRNARDRLKGGYCKAKRRSALHPLAFRGEPLDDGEEKGRGPARGDIRTLAMKRDYIQLVCRRVA